MGIGTIYCSLRVSQSLKLSHLRNVTFQTRYYSSNNADILKLAYEFWEPPVKDKTNSSSPILNNPIIFIHGLFGSKRNNRTMSKVLARDLNRPVYAIDLRNHGDSPHSSRHDYMAMAKDVERFIEDHRLEQSTLIGHSMGAKTAMTVALHNPGLIENLISVDNAPVDAALQSDFGKYVQGMRRIEEAQVQKQSEADEILQEYESRLPIRQFLLTNLVRDNNASPPHQIFRIPLKTLALSLDHMADFPYKDPDEIRFKKPTLFIRGTESRYVSDETLPIIGRFFPCFKLADVEAGHWLISENPEAFRRGEFLQPPLEDCWRLVSQPGQLADYRAVVVEFLNDKT